MTFNKKMLLASTLALSLFAAFEAKADDKAANWAPRSVEEVKTDLVSQGNQTTYTVQYGDTLSTIADAMSVDVNVLAKVNQIANINLIFPGTTITANYNAQHNATGITVQGADNSSASGQSASVDFSTNEVIVGDKTTTLAAAATPAASEAPAASETTPAPTEPASSAQALPAENSALATTEQSAAQWVPVQSDTNTQENASAAQAPAQTSATETTSAPAAQTSAAEAANSAVSAQAEAPAASETSATNTTAQAAATSTPTATEPATQTQTSVNTTGMQPSAANFANQVANTYGVTDIGGVREGDSGDHGTGNAVDVMVYDDTNLGQQIADYATSNMEANNISYVIYQQKFYGPTDNIYGPANTWNQMPDRGSDTANHMDHVHVSFNN